MVTQDVPIVILGAGIAGLSAARAIQDCVGDCYQVFERSSGAGGIASSFSMNGFTFDYGIHGLYTKNTDVLSLLSGAIYGDHECLNLSIADYWKGQWTRHPAHFNLFGFSPDVTVKFLIDFLENAKSPPSTDIVSFRDWSLTHLGAEISMELIFPYARKFWRAEPEELTADWMGLRTKAPTIAEIIEGAILKDPPDRHYVQEMYYPRKGGFGGYASALASRVKVNYGKEAIWIDTQNRLVGFGDQQVVRYGVIISTIPLPVLIRLIGDSPAEILEKALQLRATSLALVSLGTDRSNVLSHHWVYVYDAEIPFARLSAPNLWAESNAPRGTSSLQAEVYFRGRNPDPDELLKEVLHALLQMNLLNNDDNIIASDVRTVEYANVIHDHLRPYSIGAIHSFLGQRGILFCGRYSFWDYSLVDEVIMRAREVAQEAIANINE